MLPGFPWLTPWLTSLVSQHYQLWVICRNADLWKVGIKGSKYQGWSPHALHGLTVGQPSRTYWEHASKSVSVDIGIGSKIVKFTSLCASINLPLSSVLNALDVLPVAPPPPPRQLTEEETQRLEEQEEDTLRELRLFLRDVTNRLSQDKRFKAFTKPVDLEEVVLPLYAIDSFPIP